MDQRLFPPIVWADDAVNLFVKTLRDHPHLLAEFGTHQAWIVRQYREAHASKVTTHYVNRWRDEMGLK